MCGGTGGLDCWSPEQHGQLDNVKKEGRGAFRGA